MYDNAVRIYTTLIVHSHTYVDWTLHAEAEQDVIELLKFLKSKAEINNPVYYSPGEVGAI